MPTIVEAGAPPIESSSWAIFPAPAGTPRDIVDRLACEAAKTMKDEASRERLADQAVVPVDATPADTAKFLRSGIDKWERPSRPRA